MPSVMCAGDNWFKLTPAGLLINTIGHCDNGFLERRVRETCGETRLEVGLCYGHLTAHPT